MIDIVYVKQVKRYRKMLCLPVKTDGDWKAVIVSMALVDLSCVLLNDTVFFLGQGKHNSYFLQ